MLKNSLISIHHNYPVNQILQIFGMIVVNEFYEYPQKKDIDTTCYENNEILGNQIAKKLINILKNLKQ